MGPNTLLLMENSGTFKKIQIASTTETLVTINVLKPGSDGSDISVEIEGLSDDEAETANLIGRRKAQILFSTLITDIFFHEIIS